jgi:hypothetical protein
MTERAELTRPRTPSSLRNMLEVRVRRVAHSYTNVQRREALREIVLLCQSALQRIDAAEATERQADG